MFYVYQLIDPTNEGVFYVGKGKQRRAWQHAEDVRKGRSSGNKAKDARIQMILDAGQEPIVLKVGEFEDQRDAFDLEVELIASTPGLTNIRRGGEGWALSGAALLRSQELRETKRKERQHQRTREWLRKWLAMVDTWKHGVTFPGMPDGDRKAQEVVDYVRWTLAQPV